MRRRAPNRWAVLAAAALAALAVAPASAQGAAPRDRPWVQSFSRPLSGWDGKLARARRVNAEGEAFLGVARNGRVTHRLRGAPSALSLDLALERFTTVTIGLGAPGHKLRLSRSWDSRVSAGRPGAAKVVVRRSPNPGTRRWVHLQARQDERGVNVTVGDRRFSLAGRTGNQLAISVQRGWVGLDNVIATRANSREALLLHRLSALQSRVPSGGNLVGADNRDQLHLQSRFWTRGFFPGSLWRAAALTPGSDLFARWGSDGPWPTSATKTRTRTTWGSSTSTPL